jgi:hypothetical protein
VKFGFAIFALALTGLSSTPGLSFERPDLDALTAEIDLVPPVAVQTLFDNVGHCDALLSSQQPNVADPYYGWQVRYSEGENHIMTSSGIFAMYGVDQRNDVVTCMVTSRVEASLDEVAAQFATVRGLAAPDSLESESENRNPRFLIRDGKRTYFFNETVRPQGAVGIMVVRPIES